MWVVIAVTTCFYNKLRRKFYENNKKQKYDVPFSFPFYLYCRSYFTKKVRNYAFTDKNTNEVQKTSEKDISEKESAYL